MNRKAGYTLFEVLVAFAIMALVLAVLLPRQTLLLQRTVGLQDRAMAQELALSELARLGGELPVRAGSETDAYGPWQIRRTVVERERIGEQQAYDVTVEILDGSDRPLANMTVIKVAE